MRIVGPFTAREDVDEYTKVTLKNGLTVILFERKAMPLVSIATYVKAGYFQGPEGQRGIAHVMEHMFFKGTSKRGVGQIGRETKGLGGTLNATTSYDCTFYYTVLPADQLQRGLEIQADALQNPALAEGELKREIQVILQEARRKLDSPLAFSLEKLYELAFDVNPLHHWRIGDESTLLPLTRQQLAEFHRRCYGPSNLVLVITGSFDRRWVLDEVVKRYGNMLAGPKLEQAFAAEPEQKETKIRRLLGDIHEGVVQLGFPAPTVFAPDWYAFKVLEAILTAGKTAILTRTLKEARRLVNSVSSSLLELKEAGNFSIALQLDPKKTEDAKLAALAELERIKEGAFEDVDLLRAKNLLERDFYREQENLSDLAFQLARYQHLAGFAAWCDTVQQYRAVTREQVIQAAQKYLVLAKCSVLEYLPESDEFRQFTSGDVYRASIEQKLPAALKQGAATEVVLEPLQEGSKGGVPPVKVREKRPNEISMGSVSYPLRKFSILRGPDVLVKESHTLPLIALGLFYPGGRSRENLQNQGITQLMARSSIKGTRRMDGMRLESVFEAAGVELEVVVEPDYFGYVLSGLAANFNLPVDMLLEILNEPNFDEEEIDKERQQLLADQARLKDDSQSYPQQLFFQALYGDHPYGFPIFGAPEVLGRLTKKNLQDWHSRWVRNGTPVAVIAGDTEGSTLAARLSNLAGRTPEAESAEVVAPRAPAAPREKIENRRTQQTASVLGFVGPKASDLACQTLLVIQNLVSGVGGRFFEELGDKQGLAYTVRAVLQPRAAGSAFYSYIATAPENEDRALSGLRAEFRRLAAAPVSEEELRRAKAFTVGSYNIRLQKLLQQVLEFGRDLVFGMTAGDIEDFPLVLQKVDAEALRETAGRVFDFQHAAAGVVRGR